MPTAPSRSFRTLLEESRRRRNGQLIDPQYDTTQMGIAAKPDDDFTYQSLLDNLRNNPTPDIPGSETPIIPQYDETQVDIADKGDPTEEYLAKLLSEYRGQGRDFGDLQGEADQMAREQGYSPDVPNATGFKGVLSKISRAAGGFLRGMNGEKNQDGSAVSLMSELDRYKRGTDDKEGFEMKRDELLKKEVIPRYASKRELDKERIGTLQGEIGLKEKQLKLREEIAYKKNKEARLTAMGTARTELLRDKLDVEKDYKAAIIELRKEELDYKSEVDEAKRATSQAYATDLSKWAEEGGGLVAAAEEAEALYNEAKSPNSAATPEQISALRKHMASTKEAMSRWKTKKPVKGASVAPKQSGVAGAVRTVDPAERSRKLAAVTNKYQYLTPEQKAAKLPSFMKQIRDAKLDYTEAEIKRALGI